MRLTKSIIRDLTIYMIGFGIATGIVFPFFVLLFGVEVSIALSPSFILACIAAGFVVGWVNINLFRRHIVSQLQVTTEKMGYITSNITKVAQGLDHNTCDLDVCRVDCVSQDELGENADTFNQLVETLALTMSGEQLISQLDQNKILELSMNQLMETTHSNAGCICLEKKGELELAYAIGLHDRSSIAKNEILLNAAANHKSYHIQFPEDIIINSVIVDVKPRELVVEPLVFNNVYIGVLMLATTSAYTATTVDKIRIMTRNVSLALHNSIIHEQIQRLAAVDPLTAVYNRRFGLTRLSEEVSRCERSKTPMGLLMVDLDHFKNINDTYGHLAGDKVLVTIAKLIKSIVREGDVIIRYGGEEFMVVLPGADSENSLKIAENIRHIVEEAVIEYNNCQIALTCSIGYTSIPEFSFKNEDALINAVDQALYRSKSKGRNSVTMSKV